MTVGTKLKEAREKKGYTLKQTADLSDLSIGFISQVERGQTDPSLSSLKRLANALGIKLKDLFDQETETHELVRKGQGNVLEVNPGVHFEALASTLTKVMEPVIKRIAPNRESGLVKPHPGEEFVWIVDGSLEVCLGDHAYQLNQGDSLYFIANQPHEWKNTSSTECTVLWIMTPPSYS